MKKRRNTLKGIYALIIHVNKEQTITIGAIGKRTFKKGLYAYVGSSQNNLEKRVRRHLKRNKPLFWHNRRNCNCSL